jgi:RHS repeat-associated protein
VGNILQENRNGTLDTFAYDDLYEITSANVNGLQYTWWYDNLGNRLREDKGFQETDYYYDAANCAVTIGGRTVTHDPNGNVTAYGADAYTWDVRGRLTKLTRTGLTVDFTYDPWGNRTSKKVNGTLTKFLLDDEDVVSEVTGATTVNTLQSPLLDQPLVRNGRYFSPNQLGSTTTLTDSVGTVVQSYIYGPFGDVTASTGESNPFQFAGRENDGTGLYYNRKRYYVPEWGRFLSEDPIGLDGEANGYAYANNNPLNWTDPDGLAPFPPGYDPRTWRTVGPDKYRTPTGQTPEDTWHWENGNPTDPFPPHQIDHWDVDRKYPDHTDEYWYDPKTGRWTEKPDSIRRRQVRERDAAKKKDKLDRKNRQREQDRGQSSVRITDPSWQPVPGIPWWYILFLAPGGGGGGGYIQPYYSPLPIFTQ